MSAIVLLECAASWTNARKEIREREREVYPGSHDEAVVPSELRFDDGSADDSGEDEDTAEN